MVKYYATNHNWPGNSEQVDECQREKVWLTRNPDCCLVKEFRHFFGRYFSWCVDAPGTHQDQFSDAETCEGVSATEN